MFKNILIFAAIILGLGGATAGMILIALPSAPDASSESAYIEAVDENTDALTSASLTEETPAADDISAASGDAQNGVDAVSAVSEDASAGGVDAVSAASADTSGSGGVDAVSSASVDTSGSGEYEDEHEDEYESHEEDEHDDDDEHEEHEDDD